jgi:hypothetical protein
MTNLVNNVHSVEFEENSKCTSIGQYAFSACINLYEITMPETVTSIGDSAFNGCTSLRAITIPENATTLGAAAFNNCTAVEEIHFNATNIEDLPSTNYVFYKVGYSGTGVKVTIGSNVTRVPAYLFCPKSSGGTDKPRITVIEFEKGSACTSIGDYAFGLCPYLTELYCLKM